LQVIFFVLGKKLYQEKEWLDCSHRAVLFDIREGSG